ncbi:hypothetical protein P167DRAFT_546101 [Morchella conica CCBAS932]|uniref:Uncharacterized protein n=1 Tax=Morchella conica CCBAS932 TaxID=1392247 RepID=A0A3N4KML6_9PEZI|nr:hypothetical protein P167DRAFT_546101 [Morchella conica CCBAS932]
MSNESLSCRDAKWTDVGLFFLVNILAHTATVPASPGISIREYLEVALFSLIVPYYGVGRALRIIKRGAIWVGDPLQQAARAEALCVVGKNWQYKKPIRGIVVMTAGDVTHERAVFSLKSRFHYRLFVLEQTCRKINLRTVHGNRCTTDEYALYALGRYQVEELSLENAQNSKKFKLELPCNHSFVKPAISLIQIVYSSISLYQNSKTQFNTAGFGAYTFVGIPFILMSLLNLLAAICSPEYPCYYLLESDLMDEARSKGCEFNGTVGRIKKPEPNPPRKGSRTYVSPEQAERGGWEFNIVNKPNNLFYRHMGRF